MAGTPAITLSHVVLHCFDLDRMVEFYTQVLGLRVTDYGTLSRPESAGARMVFLSSDPRDHHQLALAEGRSEDTSGALLHHVSYRHSSLSRLRDLRAAAERLASGEIRQANHGTHWSLYLHDPDGNMIEAFVESSWYVKQPMWRELDLSQSDDEIFAATEKMFRDDPSFRPLAEWKAEFAVACGLEESEQ